jgi:hypothetical protein
VLLPDTHRIRHIRVVHDCTMLDRRERDSHPLLLAGFPTHPG